MHDNDGIEDENDRPTRRNALVAIAFLPLFWWLMYGLASGDDPHLHGRRAAIKALMGVFAGALGQTGCVLLGLATFAGAVYWLFATMRAQAEWDENHRREVIREKQRIIQARKQNQSGPAA
jgi:hypothetical protein